MTKSTQFAACLLGGALALFTVPASATSLVSIADFTVDSGGHPYAAVTFDNVVGRQGILYTTTSGLAGTCYEQYGCGSVVALSPPAAPGGAWTLNVLHKFTGPDGSVPYAGLIFDSFGAMYGTTAHGGLGACYDNFGCGTVFKLSPPSTPGGTWTLTTLYAFTGPDGGNPTGNLIFDSFGALYGTTVAGGAKAGSGVVYKLTPPATPSGAWTQNIIHAFSGLDGARPRANLIFDTHGALYGTTERGGPANLGTVFALTPPSTPGAAWTQTVLLNFRGPDGAQAFQNLQFDTTGALYSTAWKGGLNNGGTAFKLTPPAALGGNWMESYYQFDDPRSNTLQGGLLRNAFGDFIGTTNRGGSGDCAKTHCGTVFKLIAPTTLGGAWTHTVLADFDGVNGGNPEVTPTFHLGAYYGTADYGGTSNVGTIFQFIP